jgi:hypothetical protein
MKAISVIQRCATMSAALVAFASVAEADDFMDACMGGGSSGIDMAKTCTCISGKLAGGNRADVIEALRRSNQAMTDTSKPIDPSTLPPNLMRGLQTFVLAQGDCL